MAEYTSGTYKLEFRDGKTLRTVLHQYQVKTLNKLQAELEIKSLELLHR